MRYEIAYSNDSYFELIPSGNGEIEAEWSGDIVDYFFRKGHNFVKIFDLEEVSGSPEAEAQSEANIEGLALWGFDSEGLSYVVVIDEIAYEKMYETVNELYLLKL